MHTEVASSLNPSIPPEVASSSSVDPSFGQVHPDAPSTFATLKLGQKIEEGEVIGLIGSSGSSTGAHVHVELHLTLPAGLVFPKGKTVKVDPEEIDDLQAAIDAGDERLVASSATLLGELRQQIRLPDYKSPATAAELKQAANYRAKRPDMPIAVPEEDDE
jgi:murein DD-endopeptidase MepM/ murein hydrolase activator NlpD